jgi:YD repeat-containing protein
MKSRFIIGIAAAGLIAPAAVQAQGGALAATAQRKLAVEQSAAGGGRVVAGVEIRTTQGRPYAAESISETVQVLGDGNRINRRSVTRVYRDGEGRTRREVLADDGSVRTVAISDPVARASYTLDPSTKTAYTGGSSLVTAMRKIEGAAVVTANGAPAVATTRGELEREALTLSRAGGGSRAGGTVSFARATGPDNPNVRKDDLGVQNVEGVIAAGTRTTTTIPAGAIGNAQEIRVVSEQWFSDELQVLVLTKHSDPRSGDTTYRLRNILRAEPDPSLFTVPADYTVQQRGIRQPQ